MKTKKTEIPEDYRITVRPQAFPKEKTVRVCLKTDGGDQTVAVNDPDAMEMSKMFPSEPIITVYQNGIPTILSVKQLITDTMLQVMAEQENN